MSATTLPALLDAELLREFRIHLEARGLAVGTIRRRMDYMRSLAAVSDGLLSVSLADLERVLASKRATLAPETRKNMRASWSVFYTWLVRTGRLEKSPLDLLEPVYVPRTKGRISTDDQIRRALEMASTQEKAMILLGRLGGLRLSEITNLRRMDREGDLLRVRGKGGKTRIVPINAQLADVLDRLEAQYPDGDHYFPGRYGGAMHEQSVCKIIKRRLGMNPHSLRHAAATAAYRGTGDLQAVQELLGHASLATTQRYLHMDPEQLVAVAHATSIVGLDTSPSRRERA